MGEEIAAEFLRAKKFVIIESNFRTRGGEIDLVARDPNGELVFVEVKTYASDSLTPLEEAIPRWKQRKLIRTARHYLDTIKDQNARFDVLAITRKGSSADIEHFKNAFTA